MSIRYRDKNGAERVISGLTPGGDIEYGAVATRSGTWSAPNMESGTNVTVNVTFSEPMPDNDYEVILNYASGEENMMYHLAVFNRTVNGFSIRVTNNSTTAYSGRTFSYKAFKLYDIADAEALYSTVQDIEAMIPDSASSTNKFATANDLRTETRSLDRRLDDVEDVIPSDADISNKLVTESDLSNVQIDKVEDINDVELTDIADGQTLVWDDENSKWVNGAGGKTYTAGDGIEIDSNDAISVADTYKTIFVGTRAQWDALSATDKIKYQEAHITDDVIGGEVADVVQDGLMSPITSNAVYDAISKLGTIYSGTQSVTLESSTSITSVDLNTALPAGVYLVTVTFAFNINNNGYRFSRISGATTATETTAATNGEYTTHNLTDVCVLNSDGKINVTLKQNSGSDIAVTLRYGIIRLRV